MTTLEMLIQLKKMSEPIVFSTTPVLLDSSRAEFPYKMYYRGNYKCPYPSIAKRNAGFFPRSSIKISDSNCCDTFSFGPDSFETAPFTQFPNYENGFDKCISNPLQCTSRFGSR